MSTTNLLSKVLGAPAKSKISWGEEKK